LTVSWWSETSIPSSFSSAHRSGHRSWATNDPCGAASRRAPGPRTGSWPPPSVSRTQSGSTARSALPSRGVPHSCSQSTGGAPTRAAVVEFIGAGVGLWLLPEGRRLGSS
jgi:hypothetical protein